MFKTIVVGLDGSKESEKAAELAVGLAAREDGRIIAVHVNELLVGRTGGQPLHADEDDIQKHVRAYVHQLAEHGANITLTTGTAVAGGPAHILADVAQQQSADLVVVGTRGHSQVVGLLIGSVAQRLLHISPCPVLALPASAVGAAAGGSRETAAVAG